MASAPRFELVWTPAMNAVGYRGVVEYKLHDRLR